MKTRGALVLLAAVLSGCSEGSGTLELTVDQLPALVKDTTLLIAGGITRTPAKATDLIVTVTGGAVPAADTLLGNRYEVRVRLNLNASNQLTLSATDATGSTGNSLNVTVKQDAQGPTITASTPVDVEDNVPISAGIQATFSEPVIIGSGGGIRLSQQGALVTGTTTRSADSLTLTFTPAGPLSPNAVYRLAFSGLTDVAANPVPDSTSSCFVTTPVGSTVTQSFSDSTDDLFWGGPDGAERGASGLLPSDLIAARFARAGTLFTGVLRFIGPRTFSDTANNQGLALLDFDTDQDSTTGFKPIKDQLFEASETLGPTYSSGMGAEYILGLEPHPQLGFSAYLGRYISTEEFQPLATFLPSYCGAFLGFVIPFGTQFLNDDGNMHLLVLGLSANQTEIFVDPIPTTKNLAVLLPAPSGAPPFSVSTIVTEPVATRAVRVPSRRIPLR